MSLVAEIVLTGGPCGGKTTAMTYLRAQLNAMGYCVLTVPEAATIVMNGGCGNIGYLAMHNRAAYVQIQSTILSLFYELKRNWQNIASRIYVDEQVVIIYDRAEMDSLAYMARAEFDGLMRVHGYDRGEYDAVIHLVTAADGALGHYTLSNNSARREADPAEAIAADQATQSAWADYPNLVVIDNSTDFQGKLERLMRHVTTVLSSKHTPIQSA